MQQSAKDPVEALEDLPGDCSATNLMRQLARAALATERPGPDVMRILALAREPLSLEELTAVLHNSGREEDIVDVDGVLKWRPIINVLERRGNGEERYRPYHDWMRAAIVRLTQPVVARPYHQALGEFYWDRLQKDKQDERAIRHCAHHLAQGQLDDAEAKKRFLVAVARTAEQKSTWGLTEDIREELTLARRLLEDEMLDVGPLTRAVMYNQCGLLAMDIGDLPAALAHFEHVREVAPKLRRLLDESATQALGVALGNIGSVYLQMGRLEQALVAYKQAGRIAQDVGDRKGEADDSGNMGLVYRHMGRLEEALAAHERALEIHREIGYRKGEADDLGNIGLVYRDWGRVQEALAASKRALEVARESGYRQGEANQLGSIGGVYARLGCPQEALAAYEQALGIGREIGYRRGEAQDLGNIGLVYFQMGRLEDALKKLKEALDIDREIGFQLGEARQLGNIGRVYEEQGKLPEALDCLRQALDIFEETGAALDIERTKRHIARIEEKLSGSEG